ncbi:type I restriction-modification system endonuclease [Pseudohalioglobus lutimaris]|uniref:Type I restriction-modification system endonuclease n=1 Tax=Pseudohalioglobus lutimaris TaxID=1737061 RepID=A0A2N5X0Y3_9GAMM|nr:type I restriction-modification system endonuclease [Pseudohalioglobus lutimaris]PLW68159.1 type I restriction-modification system endonuclease [Pseudohalioglobus lutimaris]
MSSNFFFLESHDPLLLQLASTAEQAFVPDPNTTLLKLRQLGEAIAQDIASRLGIEVGERTTQLDLLRKIQQEASLPREVAESFHDIRRTGNVATHEFTTSHREALQGLRMARNLAVWYHRTFGNAVKDWKPGAFVTPEDPSVQVRDLEERIAQLLRAQQASQRELNVAQQLAEAEAQKAAELEKYAERVKEDAEVWQSLAHEQEVAYLEAKQAFEKHQHEIVEAAAEETVEAQEQVAEVRDAIKTSVWYETEAETRLRIDQQLCDAGWEADTQNLRYASGARPESGKCKAIAEWPTASGPADYILFDGLLPVATVEAKKASKSVAGDIDQAERYSRDIKDSDEISLYQNEWPVEPGNPEKGSYRIPFAFSTNGRPYLEQHQEMSGIWFRDLRRPQNNRKVNDGWYSPEGLQSLLKQDLDAAEEQLQQQSFNFDFQLRYYQIDAIRAAERAIRDGQDHILLAMATGTGKTKTAIAMIYRLLQAQRFRRILFLVDRSALGEQTADAFATTKMLNQQTFADTFNIKGLKEATPDTATQVHVATVQGMVKRILYAEDDRPTVDQYDCIVVDECHRGYLLDRELDDTEVKFRSQHDYISKYRRVVDFFDAVKIGLTATPALHTTEIFGEPVYLYSYREAVIDGYLIDHEPPFHIKTRHNQEGIDYAVGDKIAYYDSLKNSIDYAHVEDEVNFDISKINRVIEDEAFNRIVCNVLAENIDPFDQEKTLIFCATDRHADMVVRLMKDAIAEAYGDCEDGLVKKITGNTDKPLEAIRFYKNDRLPNIAVTVDLLTTGVDVPEICNLVFLRPVKSRILYEQMKGRATRQCPEIGKEVFRIFDAVNLYDNLEPLTNMKPVVVSPNISFQQLEQEIVGKQTHDSEQQELARDQFIAKLQRKRRNMSDEAREAFETTVGQAPEDFINDIKTLPIAEVADWFINHPGLGEFLDTKSQSSPPVIFISEKDDELLDVAENYGKAVTPADYLSEFESFIKDHENDMIALQTIIHQPGKITRQQIKELMLELSEAQFTEKNLRKAWALASNKDIAARIVGYVRKAAVGDALVPWEERVDNAIGVILTQKPWKPAQKNLLKDIGELLKTRLALDEQSINESALRRKGGFNRVNKMFDGELPQLLEAINEAVWDQTG